MTSILVPLFEGPDEDDHFRYTKYLADFRALPVQSFQQGGGTAGHQGWQPPFYYALAALVISPIDTSDYPDRLQRNPAAALEGDLACCGRNNYFHFDAEDFPFQETTLAVHLARGVTIAFGLVCVYAIYGLTLTLLPARRYLALATTAIATLNPSFLYSSALVSNDIPLVAFCTLALLAAAKILTEKWEPDWKAFALLGMWLGLALLTKTTALGLIGLSFFVVLYMAWEQRGDSPLSARFLLTRGFALAAPVALLTGWYFARNQIEYGDPLAYRLIAASALPPRDAPLTLPELLSINFPWLWQTFWGGPTPGDFPRVLLNVFLGALIVGVIGTALYLVREWRALGRNRLAAFGLMLGWFGFVFAAQVQFIRTASGTDQGRYLFPAISTLALVYALGWSHVVWRIGSLIRRPFELVRAERMVAIVCTAFFIALASFVLVTFTLPAYAAPAMIDPASIAQRGAPIDADFANGMQLRGSVLSARAVTCNEKLGVTLFWTSDEPIRDTYRVFAHLVNDQGAVAGNKDVIPGGGAYPTVYWKPGEYFADTINVPLNRGARAGNYRVIVGTYKVGEPEHRVNLRNSEEDFVMLGDVQVNAPVEGCP